MELTMAQRCDDMLMLHPMVKPKFLLLQARLERSYRGGFTKTLFRPFETFRTPQRQAVVFATGKSRANIWHSAHQYGFAVDFVPWGDHGWTWNGTEDYDFLQKAAEAEGLGVPLEWDRCHVEADTWQRLASGQR